MSKIKKHRLASQIFMHDTANEGISVLVLSDYKISLIINVGQKRAQLDTAQHQTNAH